MIRQWLKRHPQQSMLLVILVLGFFVTFGPSYIKQGEQCGRIKLSAGASFLEAGSNQTISQIVNCFSQAYQHCRTASLTTEHENMDTPPTTDIAVVEQRQNQCVVSFYSTTLFPLLGAENTCSNLILNHISLTFSGCQTSIDATTIIVSEFCGVISGEGNTDTRACVVRNAAHCAQAHFNYERDNHLYIFNFTDACGVIMQDTFPENTSPKATSFFLCQGGMVQKPAALLFRSCGRDGDMLISTPA